MSTKKKYAETKFEFRSFDLENHPYRLIALDGSNHNIEGRNFVLSTLKAGYLMYETDEQKEGKEDPYSYVDDIMMEFISNSNDSLVGFKAKHEKYYEMVTGRKTKRKVEFEKVTDRIRTLLEWNKVIELLDKLDRNDIIIFDGSLISGVISMSEDFFLGLAEKAQSRGILLVGLSKDTSLSMGAIPMPSVLLEASRIQHPNQNFLVSYDGVDYVRFLSDHDAVYRIDFILPNDVTKEQVSAWLGSYCLDDRSIYGYPFPMEMIHKEVMISKLENQYCFDEFRQSCLDNGVSYETFEEMFAIFHDELDKHTFGR